MGNKETCGWGKHHMIGRDVQDRELITEPGVGG